MESQYAQLKQFLKTFQVPRTAPFTHVCLSNPKKYYRIPDMGMKAFMELYSNTIAELKEQRLHLTLSEKPHKHGPLIINLNFRSNDNQPVYTNNDIKTFICAINECLKSMHNIDDAHLQCYVMENNQIRQNGDEFKSGLHLQYPFIKLATTEMLAIRDAIIDQSLECFPTAINDMSDIYDKRIIEGRYWFMYGSGKSIHKPYLLTSIIDHTGFPSTNSIQSINQHRLAIICSIHPANTTIQSSIAAGPSLSDGVSENQPLIPPINQPENYTRYIQQQDQKIQSAIQHSLVEGTFDSIARVLFQLFHGKYAFMMSHGTKTWLQYKHHQWVPMDGCQGLQKTISRDLVKMYTMHATILQTKIDDLPNKDPIDKCYIIIKKLKTITCQRKIMLHCENLFFVDDDTFEHFNDIVPLMPPTNDQLHSELISDDSELTNDDQSDRESSIEDKSDGESTDDQSSGQVNCKQSSSVANIRITQNQLGSMIGNISKSVQDELANQQNNELKELLIKHDQLEIVIEGMRNNCQRTMYNKTANEVSTLELQENERDLASLETKIQKCIEAAPM